MAPLILAIWIVGLTAALAQQAPAPHPSPTALLSPWVGTKSAPVANPNPHRAGLYVFNPSNAVPLWVAPAGTLAAVSGAGSIVIQPGQGVMFGPPGMPPWTSGMNAIAPQDGPNAITILEFTQ